MTVRMKEFLCADAKLAATGANHWISKVNFALDEGRGTIRSSGHVFPVADVQRSLLALSEIRLRERRPSDTSDLWQ